MHIVLALGYESGDREREHVKKLIARAIEYHNNESKDREEDSFGYKPAIFFVARIEKTRERDEIDEWDGDDSAMRPVRNISRYHLTHEVQIFLILLAIGPFFFSSECHSEKISYHKYTRLDMRFNFMMRRDEVIDGNSKKLGLKKYIYPSHDNDRDIHDTQKERECIHIPQKNEGQKYQKHKEISHLSSREDLWSRIAWC